MCVYRRENGGGEPKARPPARNGEGSTGPHVPAKKAARDKQTKTNKNHKKQNKNKTNKNTKKQQKTINNKINKKQQKSSAK